jgi:hypothetical protein
LRPLHPRTRPALALDRGLVLAFVVHRPSIALTPP